MSSEKDTNKTAIPPSSSSDLLGRWRMWTKACNDWLWSKHGPVNDRKDKLREMQPYPGVLSDIIDALKKKGMRFDEVSLDNGDIRYLDNNIVVFRGDAAKLLHCAFHRLPSGVSRKKMRQYDLRLSGLFRTLRGIRASVIKRLHTLTGRFKCVHKYNLPNMELSGGGDQESA